MRLSRYECRKMGVCEVEAYLGRDKEAGAHNLSKVERSAYGDDSNGRNHE